MGSVPPPSPQAAVRAKEIRARPPSAAPSFALLLLIPVALAGLRVGEDMLRFDGSADHHSNAAVAAAGFVLVGLAPHPAFTRSIRFWLWLAGTTVLVVATQQAFATTPFWWVVGSLIPLVVGRRRRRATVRAVDRDPVRWAERVSSWDLPE